MAHAEQNRFCQGVRLAFPSFFTGCRVLDCGSLNVNGTNRSLFSDCEYVGIDVAQGDGVDVVGKVHEYDAIDGYFDTIISTEMLEHDMYWRLSLLNMYRMLRSGGLLILTCATIGRPEHGTIKRKPKDSPITATLTGWKNYYMNLRVDDISGVLPESLFTMGAFSTNDKSHDLYFWGVKV